jgi:antitoxin (DNA-binding transcriptional repressor) of toxin-antitoxin stability system
MSPRWVHSYPMKIVTIRDLRTRPRQVRESLAGETEAVLTVSGRPVAILVPTDAATVDETLESVRRARALDALRAIRRASRARGLDRLKERDVEAIIAKTRRARRRRARG